MDGYQVVYKQHAFIRMIQRKISKEEVLRALAEGETIRLYPDDTPYPSELILHWSGPRPLHVVVATNVARQEKIVVTVYEPNLNRWEDGFRRKKLL
jgi:hypothetical protein